MVIRKGGRTGLVVTFIFSVCWNTPVCHDDNNGNMLQMGLTFVAFGQYGFVNLEQFESFADGQQSITGADFNVTDKGRHKTYHRNSIMSNVVAAISLNASFEK